MPTISFVLDGRPRVEEVVPGERVSDLLVRLGARGIRKGCDHHGQCGACTILLDGRTVPSCLLLAPQIHGRDVTTIEAFSRPRVLSALQSALVDCGVVQCGYCTPAMVLALEDLLARVAEPGRAEVTDALSGVFCRCTGYEQVFGAVALARARLRDPAFAGSPAPEFREDLLHVGKVRRKVDGALLARGGRAFVEDRVEPGTCHLKMLGSPHAHAWIADIDTSAAEALPGVIRVFTWRNTPALTYTTAGQSWPEPSPYDRRMFARKVRHVGDRVAAVLAETPEIAEEALGRIRVSWEVLPPVFTPEEAAAEGAPCLHSGPLSFLTGAPADLDARNADADPRDEGIHYCVPIHADPRRNVAASVSGGIGDVARGFAEADVVLDRTYSGGHVQCTPLEPHVVLTRMDGDRLLIHASTQVPFHLRRIVSRILGVPETRVRVVKEHTGGAFGAKQDMVVEDVAAWATWVTGRPALWRYTREEEFVAARTRHPMTIRVRLGATRDGRLTAIEMDVRANTGPYGGHCLTVPMNACSKSLPLFLCDNVHFEVTSYYTDIPPTGAYQGYGAPKGSFALQLAAAEMADALGIDPLAFLERNRVREGSMLEILRCLGEGREGRAQRVSSCGLGPALERGAARIGWGRREAPGRPHVRIGKGVAIVQQGSGLPGVDAANAVVTQNGDGTFLVHSGGTDLGTGLDTVVAKVVAECLQVPMDHVAVLAADTDVTPFDAGAYASSGTFFSGGAALRAAERMRDLLLDAAARLLDEPRDGLAIAFPGEVRGPRGTVDFERIARATQSGTGSGQLVAWGSFVTDEASFPYGAHFAEVEVDTGTGAVTVRRYAAVQDAGTPINPELALGQVYGGILKTIGHSLWEEMRFDSEGRCLNPTLRDYRVPMIGDLPPDVYAELVCTDDPVGPYGAKSVAEISCNGAAPAIAAAIHDAVGVWIRDWPFTPEKVLRALGSL